MVDIHLETVLPLSPSAAYRLFTQPVMLEQWMCNGATVEARVGGSFFYTWAAGWWAVGKYTAVVPNQRLAFTWQPEGAPAITQADVTFSEEGDNTRVTIHHTGYDDPAIWSEQARATHLEGWTSALNDLAYFVENGLDARFMRRPMMGINMEALTPELVSRLGSPVKSGLALNGVVEGSGAANAGLKPNDIIVEMDGAAISHYHDLGAVIQRHNAGESVNVTFYRGQDKHTVQLTFGQRPTPHIAQTQEALVDQIREQIAAVIGELDAALTGATEAEMSFNPAEGEWNVKQILAHCIWGERWSAMNIWTIAGGGEYIGWVGNPAHQIAGILVVHPTADALKAELMRSMNELPPMIAALDSATLTNPAVFKYLSLINAETGEHVREHISQMKAAIEAARQTVPA